MVTRPRLWLKTTSEKGPHLSCVVFTKRHGMFLLSVLFSLVLLVCCFVLFVFVYFLDCLPLFVCTLFVNLFVLQFLA